MQKQRVEFDRATSEVQLASKRSRCVRPLGALERLYYRLAQHHTMQHCTAIELNHQPTVAQLERALDELQRRHPLLSTHIEEQSELGPSYCQTLSKPAHILLTTISLSINQSWQTIAEREFTLPFDRNVAPMMRLTQVLPSDQTISCILLITLDHMIADGMSVTYIIRDLIRALNGQQLDPLPFPLSQEERIQLSRSIVRHGGDVARNATIETTAESSERFEPAAPRIENIALSIESTSRLKMRCREEKTTVHAAILAAAAIVLTPTAPDGSIRALTPINIRNFVEAEQGCMNCLIFKLSELQVGSDLDIWDLARTAKADIETVSNLEGMYEVSRSVEAAFPPNATNINAEMMMRDLSYTVASSNLGVFEYTDGDDIRATAIWPPAAIFQVPGETYITVLTHDGVLRLTSTSYAPVPFFLQKVSRLPVSV